MKNPKTILKKSSYIDKYQNENLDKRIGNHFYKPRYESEDRRSSEFASGVTPSYKSPNSESSSALMYNPKLQKYTPNGKPLNQSTQQGWRDPKLEQFQANLNYKTLKTDVLNSDRKNPKFNKHHLHQSNVDSGIDWDSKKWYKDDFETRREPDQLPNFSLAPKDDLLQDNSSLSKNSVF